MQFVDAADGAEDGLTHELGGEPVLVISTDSDGTAARLTLTGELDLDGAGRLRQAALGVLQSGALTTLEVDLAGLRFIDSAGLQAVLLARRLTEDAHATFRLVAVSPAVARVIDIAGLGDSLVPSDQDVDN